MTESKIYPSINEMGKETAHGGGSFNKSYNK